MKITLKERMATFLDQRSHNRQQRLCLIPFLMLSLSVVLPGVPMHIVGSVSYTHLRFVGKECYPYRTVCP